VGAASLGLQQVGRGDDSLVCGDGREWELAGADRRVACSVNSRVRDALQVRIDLHSTIRPGGYSRGFEPEMLGVRDPPAAVDDEVYLDGVLLILRLRENSVSAAGLLDPNDFRVKPCLHAQTLGMLYEPRHEVRVELGRGVPRLKMNA
jgi:hypothetical protein